MENMKLRPHHLIDIISDIGKGKKIVPSPTGHAVHIVTEKVMSNTDITAEFIIGADDICSPCVHQKNGLCDDPLYPDMTKQEYNDKHDKKIFDYLGFKPGAVMTIKKFLEIINSKVPDIKRVCSHRNEDQEKRLKSLIEGLKILNIRKE